MIVRNGGLVPVRAALALILLAGTSAWAGGGRERESDHHDHDHAGGGPGNALATPEGSPGRTRSREPVLKTHKHQRAQTGLLALNLIPPERGGNDCALQEIQLRTAGGFLH